MSFFKEQIMGLEPENKPKINSEQISDNIATKNIHMMSKSMAEIRAVKRVNKPEKIVEEKTPMDNKTLKIKKLKGYRNAFWVFLILTYVIGRAGEMIKQSGGTSEGIAIFIVAVQAIAPLVMVFCGVMWIKIKRQ